MRIGTIYDLEMPKFVYVQIAGIQQPARVKGDTVVEDGPNFIVKLGNEQVGQFKTGTVQGWWIQDEGGGGH